MIALYAGELVWKDREAGSAEIVDAAPVPTGVALLGRFLALVAIIVAFQTAFMVGGVLLQTLHGYYDFEPGLYVQRPLRTQSRGSRAARRARDDGPRAREPEVHRPHPRAAGERVPSSSVRWSGIHRMLVYNSDPGWTYTDMNGFGPFLEPFVWFKAYWAAWALLLAVIAILFWVRGTESGVRHRLAHRARAFAARRRGRPASRSR